MMERHVAFPAIPHEESTGWAVRVGRSLSYPEVLWPVVA